MNIDDWWTQLINDHKNDGKAAADNGVYDPPYPGSEDPQDEIENLAYDKGFNERRSELGVNFKWKTY